MTGAVTSGCPLPNLKKNVAMGYMPCQWSARDNAVGRGVAEAADGRGQQDALCTHEPLYPQVRMAQGRAIPSRSLALEGILQGLLQEAEAELTGGGQLRERLVLVVWLGGAILPTLPTQPMPLQLQDPISE